MLHRPFLKDIKNKAAREAVRKAREEAALCKLTALNPGINATLLILIREKIKIDPAHFYMGNWFSKMVEDVTEPSGIYYAHPSATHSLTPTCGTAACIAGWAVSIDAGIKATALSKIEADSDLTFSKADELLGLTHDQTEALFYTMTWHTKLSDHDRRTPEAAINYINQILNGEIEIFNKADL